MRTIDSSDLDTFHQERKLTLIETLPHGEDSHGPAALVDKKHIHDDGRTQRESGRKQIIENSSSNELIEGFCISGTEYRDED